MRTPPLSLNNFYSLDTTTGYAFYVWPRLTPRRIVFLYSCPSASPVKHRMLYSCAFNFLYVQAKALFQEDARCTLLARKIETSEPRELDERYLRDSLGAALDEIETGRTEEANVSEGATPVGAPSPLSEERKFAKPRGPARRAR